MHPFGCAAGSSFRPSPRFLRPLYNSVRWVFPSTASSRGVSLINPPLPIPGVRSSTRSAYPQTSNGLIEPSSSLVYPLAYRVVSQELAGHSTQPTLHTCRIQGHALTCVEPSGGVPAVPHLPRAGRVQPLPLPAAACSGGAAVGRAVHCPRTSAGSPCRLPRATPAAREAKRAVKFGYALPPGRIGRGPQD